MSSSLKGVRVGNVKANIPPLNIMFFESTCMRLTIANLMHDITNKKAPENICKLFTYISDVHSYNTLDYQHLKNYILNQLEYNIKKRYFSRMGVRLWNKIPLVSKIHQKRVQKREHETTFFVT